MLLPHDEFVFAELKREGKDQTLRLVFVTHEVLVRGQALRRIETAIQRMELSLLTKLPSSQRSLIADGQPVILGIIPFLVRYCTIMAEVAYSAMPKRFHLNRPDRAKAVADALPTCTNVIDHQRLLAMRLAASGQLTADQIAQQVGISRRQFFNWVSALKKGGVTELLAREHGGGVPPQVQGKVLKEFQAGLKAGQWKRAKEISSGFAVSIGSSWA